MFRRRLNVTLFKGSASDQGDEQDDHFVRTLTKTNGERVNVGEVKVIPVLDFEFISLDILWRHLQQPQKFQGMILTSQRCVDGLKKCITLPDASLSWETNIKKCWLNKKIFCVGPSTATRFIASFDLEESFRENIIVSKGGNSQSLAQSILEEDEKSHIDLPLLYPCGSLKMDTLGTCLTERNILFEAITVYKTMQNPGLEAALLGLRSMSDTEEDVLVFFSPSGVGFVLPHLVNLSSKHIVAIGSTTADALKKSKFTADSPIHQCSTPTPDGLLEVLEKLF